MIRQALWCLAVWYSFLSYFQCTLTLEKESSMCIITNKSFIFLPFCTLSRLFLVRYFFRSRLQEAKKYNTKQAQKHLEIKWVHSHPPILLENLRKLTPTQTLNWKSFRDFKNISICISVLLILTKWEQGQVWWSAQTGQPQKL